MTIAVRYTPFFISVVITTLGSILSSIEGNAQTHQSVEIYYDTAKKIKREVFLVKKKKGTAVRDSSYTSFYQNGKVKSKGTFKDNEPAGLWEYYYESGLLKSSGHIRHELKYGNWKYYYENGNLSTEGTYDAGKKTGDWHYYFESNPDVVKTEGAYINDKREGPWKFYDETGAFKAQADFHEDKGLYTEYYTGGAKKSEGLLVEGKSSGTWTYYYENGKMLGKGEEKNGLKEGEWIYYDKSGSIESKGLYEDGKQAGTWEYYHENGSVASKGEYVNDKKEGDWTTFNTAGKKIGEGNFKSGKGNYREFYDSGKLKIEGAVENDKNEGLWNYYYETGEREGKCFYQQGKGKYLGYYKDGTNKMEGLLEDGHKTGIWRLYKPNGELAGLYKTYYDRDAPAFEQTPLDSVVSSLPKDTLPPIQMPNLILRKKKSRYFTPRVNEFRGYIVGANPLALFRNTLPVSVEIYFQERIGYEFGVSYNSMPFFSSHSTAPLNDLDYVGYQLFVRQKFYQRDQDYGMFYFAHELRYTNTVYSVRVTDTLMTPVQDVHLDLKERTIEYSLLVGDRLVKDTHHKGFTLDIFIGLGIGYRMLERNWSEENKIYKNAFSSVSSSIIKVPVRLGFTIGYIFPRAQAH
jgi:antitoxin component YwqK of YwqJK toxin-antitoxin module